MLTSLQIFIVMVNFRKKGLNSLSHQMLLVPFSYLKLISFKNNFSKVINGPHLRRNVHSTKKNH